MSFPIRFPSKAAKRRAAKAEREALAEGLLEGSERAFRSALDSGDPLIALFGAAWCGPCRIIKPRVDDVAKHHPKVTAMYLSIDEPGMDRIAMEYHVQGVPTIMAFRDGLPIDSRLATSKIVADMFHAAEGRS